MKQNGAHDAKNVDQVVVVKVVVKVRQLHSTRRLCFVHPVHRMRSVHGECHHLLPELSEDPQKFVDYLRMQPTTFHVLLVSVRLVINESSRPNSSTQY